jgi:UDP-N-acetylglucosamine 2-epimerase
MKKKKIITVTGIRPDFIRMSEIFKKLDQHFDHILIHTGQHYDSLLSDVFFDELEIRIPDYNLGIGGPGKEHFHQSAELSVRVIELIREKNINPDLILFLGDSNSALAAVPLKKEGYTIGHIEAGMRSGDKRMLEEINRIVCDACSDFLFVYHDNYKGKLQKENITKNVYVVGNTIAEVANKFKPLTDKKFDKIILDIHRPENFKYKGRLENIIQYATKMSELYKLPVYLLGFKRTLEKIKDFDIELNGIQVMDLLPFKKYINEVYDSKFIISDSGTAQEEPAILGTPVIVPRDFTERPESVENGCSFMLDVNSVNNTWNDSINWLNSNPELDEKWLGDGKTSDTIIKILKNKL